MDKVAAIIRHALTGIGGALVATGVIDQETANQGLAAWADIIGGVTFLVGLGWSIYDKIGTVRVDQ